MQGFMGWVVLVGLFFRQGECNVAYVLNNLRDIEFAQTA